MEGQTYGKAQKWAYCDVSLDGNDTLITYYGGFADHHDDRRSKPWLESAKKHLQKVVASLGVEGWELVNVGVGDYGTVYYLKQSLA